MSNLGTLTLRELKSWVYSPIAYVVGAVFLFLQGWVFWMLIAVLNDPRGNPSWSMAQFFFGGSFFYWFTVMIIAPLLTMRSFSEEKRSGSIELLLTAPVTSVQVVLAKFLGSWLIYNFLWVLTVPFFLVLNTLTPFDWGPVIGGYVGTWLLGSCLMAIGTFASSITRNQVIAAVITFVILIFLFSVSILSIFVQDPETAKLLQYCSLPEHLRSFSKGIVDTRPMAFYSSITAVFLFLTVRVINHPR